MDKYKGVIPVNNVHIANKVMIKIIVKHVLLMGYQLIIIFAILFNGIQYVHPELIVPLINVIIIIIMNVLLTHALHYIQIMVQMEFALK